jgi:hypothetical protein
VDTHALSQRDDKAAVAIGFRPHGRGEVDRDTKLVLASVLLSFTDRRFEAWNVELFVYETPATPSQ